MNLNDILNYNARKNPNKTAVVETRGDKKISYKNLVFLIERYASFLLKNEVVCGSRVSIKLKNSIEWIAFFYAVLKIGAIPVLIDFQSTSFEISQFLEISNSSFIAIEENDKILKDKTFIEKDIVKSILIIPAASNRENRLKNDKITYFEDTDNLYKSLFSHFCGYSKIILFTYRGFGFPLSVEYEEKNLILSVLSNISASRINGESIVAHLLPSTHIFGLSCNILSTLTSGGELLVVNNFTPKEMLIKMDLYNANFITAVPTIIKLFIDTAKKTGSNLKKCKKGIVGGNSFSRDLFEEWNELTLGGILIQGYGLTETSPVLCNPWEGYKIESLGKPMRGTDFLVLDKDNKIVDINMSGRLFVRKTRIFKNYTNFDEKKLFYDDYFDTADIVYKDKEGFYYFVERDKNIAKIGGTTVDIEEIKKTILEIPEISSCNIKIEYDPLWREKLICEATSEKSLCKDSIAEYLRNKLSGSKIPKDIFVR